mgnify:CR=1 FL=1|jgi:hypothetical protein
MYPEDRVLVGVINRQRDLRLAREQHWYRVPQGQMPRGIHADYLAFYLSGLLRGQPSGVYVYTRPAGMELHYRKDLLPKEASHPRALDVYYRVALEPLRPKDPPILNPTRRPITFIHTTWDRFIHATQIRDLYSDADYYVDRLYHALRSRGVATERYWESERRLTNRPPGLRILCENGGIDAATEPGGDFFLDTAQQEDQLLKALLLRIAQQGGAVMLPLPHNIR